MGMPVRLHIEDKTISGELTLSPRFENAHNA